MAILNYTMVQLSLRQGSPDELEENYLVHKLNHLQSTKNVPQEKTG